MQTVSHVCDEIIDNYSEFSPSQGPVIIVPTKYYTTPTQHFRDMGVSMVIWANHNLRASVQAMQRTSAAIFNECSLQSVEPNVSYTRLLNTLYRHET